MKNEKFVRIFILVFFFSIFFRTSVFAQSNYVLPYPSNMPGSIFYKLHLIYEKVSKHWYFGDFGQFDYNLKLAEKYLVEAKTLFEYKQYLLGHEALQKSDFYFSKTLPSLIKAEKNNKNIVQKRSLLREAGQKHIETLEKIQTDTPDIFNWQPERALPTILNIKESVNSSINIRKNAL